MAGSVVVSWLSTSVVGEAISWVGDGLEWVSEGAISSVKEISDALADCGCRCPVVDSEAAAVGLEGAVVVARPSAVVAGGAIALGGDGLEAVSEGLISAAGETSETEDIGVDAEGGSRPFSRGVAASWIGALWRNS